MEQDGPARIRKAVLYPLSYEGEGGGSSILAFRHEGSRGAHRPPPDRRIDLGQNPGTTKRPMGRTCARLYADTSVGDRADVRTGDARADDSDARSLRCRQS